MPASISPPVAPWTCSPTTPARFDVTVEDGDIVVASRPDGDRVGQLRARLQDGLEDGLTLVMAKSVLGLLAAAVEPAEIVRAGVHFGTAYRDAGWGAGLTVLVAMANLMADLDEGDRALALVHGLSFVLARHPQPPAAVRDRPASGGGHRDRPPGRLVPTVHRHPLERCGRTRIGHGAGHGARRPGPGRGRADDVRRRH